MTLPSLPSKLNAHILSSPKPLPKERMTKFSKQEQEQIMQELNSDRGNVSIYCADHLYHGPDKRGRGLPTRGCSKCWLCYFYLAFANCPPGKRQEFVDRLEETIHHLIETKAKGKIDFKLNRHPEVIIEKDGMPDIIKN